MAVIAHSTQRPLPTL